MIKYIALDLDGTLTNEDKVITPRTYEALMDAQRKGIRLILASGRPPYGMQPLCKQLQMDQYGGIMLAYNGGHTERCDNGEVLTEIKLDDTLLPEVYEFQKKYNMVLMTYFGEHIYTEDDTDQYVLQSSKNNKMSVIKVSDFVADAPRPINKCLMVGDPSVAPLCEKELTEYFDGRLNICRSTPYFIEILPLGIDKGDALKELMPLLGSSTDELMAFGDSFNDINMLRVAGIGVAMGNAEDEVKAVANHVTLSNEQDGIAEAIKALLPNVSI